MLHDYLSKAKSSKFHYFVLSIGTVRRNPIRHVIAREKAMLHHSFNILHSDPTIDPLSPVESITSTTSTLSTSNDTKCNT